MPQSVCLTTAAPLERAVAEAATSNASGRVVAEQRQLALHAQPAAVGGGLDRRSSGT